MEQLGAKADLSCILRGVSGRDHGAVQLLRKF
jgi:hypothetical protein